MQILNGMKKQEYWRKMKSAKGIVSEKSITKSGSIKIILSDDKAIYINKRNKNIYEKADKLHIGDNISARGRIWLGKLLVFKLDKLNKPANKKEIQMKL